MVSSDGPGEYPIIGESRAGSMDAMAAGPGTVAYITTGEAHLDSDHLIAQA